MPASSRAATGADSYQIEVTFENSIVANMTALSSAFRCNITQYNFPDPGMEIVLGNGSDSWRVRAQSAGVWSEWSTIGDFTISGFTCNALALATGFGAAETIDCEGTNCSAGTLTCTDDCVVRCDGSNCDDTTLNCAAGAYCEVVCGGSCANMQINICGNSRAKGTKFSALRPTSAREANRMPDIYVGRHRNCISWLRACPASGAPIEEQRGRHGTVNKPVIMPIQFTESAETISRCLKYCLPTKARA